MDNISRDNHLVPQMYLRAWEDKDCMIHVYDLLVPNKNCNEWRNKKSKGIAYQRDFYTNVENAKEEDYLEKIFNEKYETPAKEPLTKAINGDKLDADDWSKLIDFIGIQIIRTKARALEILKISKSVLERDMPNELNKIVGKLSDENVNIKKLNKEKRRLDSKVEKFKMPLEGKIEDYDNDKKILKVEATMGKGLYLYMLNDNEVKDVLNILHRHKWQVIDITNNISIPTSDDPVIRLQYCSKDEYNFNGGINQKGVNIIFPISPNKIIYTQVGYGKKVQFNEEFSIFIKKIIVEHAYRHIYSCNDDDQIKKIRKREVDKAKFDKEKKIESTYIESYKKYAMENF